MAEMNIIRKLIRLIKLTMAEITCTVRIQSDTSPEFKTNRGLRPGDALACLLFNLALERLLGILEYRHLALI
uniref:Putative endonuclease-reverse transcriptase n=1 Tax=Panstrongylus lignarius TaxID=156445 RepID=A0A224XXP2_9HEMI